MSTIRASGLDIKAAGGVMPPALRLNIENLLNMFILGEVLVLSKVFIPLLGTGLLRVENCTICGHGEDPGKNFILASDLNFHSQSQIWSIWSSRKLSKLAIK